MDDEFLYLQIASSIRRDIANGLYKIGDQLPSVRSYSEIWHCTIGTVQRGIQKLVAEGVVSSHIGKGTKVTGPITLQPEDTLKRAHLIHKAEKFLLDAISSGFSTTDVEDSMRVAITRWQTVSQSQANLNKKTIRFCGSHDLVVAWLATHFQEIFMGYKLQLSFSGSLSGLMALLKIKRSGRFSSFR
jgi:DNA-binding transcriptional regulator YhcF (GntR family)